MKNQYVGDIGDYSKFGVLRALLGAGFSLGINWYLTPDDGNSDGGHIEFLEKPCDTSDNELYDTLKKIVSEGRRFVCELEKSGLLKDTLFYNEVLTCEDRFLFRTNWHRQAIDKLKGMDCVFLDPDNGLEIKSVNPNAGNGNKYVTYAEVVDYYSNGHTVIIYNHKDFLPEAHSTEKFKQFRDITTNTEDIFYLRAPRCAVRYYLFISQPKHTRKIRETIKKWISSGWREYITFCDLP
jgi:hypothetical protein